MIYHTTLLPSIITFIPSSLITLLISIDTTSRTITNTNDQHNQRRDSYQDSLKDMAALMTDVELTDDMINGMRKRFDLHN